jgi:hypothetical protein
MINKEFVSKWLLILPYTLTANDFEIRDGDDLLWKSRAYISYGMMKTQSRQNHRRNLP